MLLVKWIQELSQDTYTQNNVASRILDLTIYTADQRSWGKPMVKIISTASAAFWQLRQSLHFMYILCIRTFQFFLNAQNWKHCQLCIPRYFLFPSLLVPYNISKREITCWYQWEEEDYIPRLQTSLVQFLSNGTSTMKLTILALL